MVYEVYTRIMVGLPLAHGVLADVVSSFHQNLGVEPTATAEEVYALLRDDAPKHKRHEPDRGRYELALEAHVDALWDVDCALSGVSDGLADPARCQLWVGVRVEQMEHTTRVDAPAQYVRPRVLRKGDLSMGSDFSRELGADMYKQFRHATQMYQRARLQIEGDAITRTKKVPTSRQHEVAWSFVRWIVPVKG
jgi:hypothetical protein